MVNIVYSATRQWNPGDEFILLGTKYLINQVIKDHNAILYNRSPHIRQDIIYVGANRLQRFLTKFAKTKFKKNDAFLDNSVKTDQPMNYADLVIFAGSPEWYGDRLSELYQSITEYNIPTLFIGIGSADKFKLENFSENEKSVLKKAKLIICRDLYCKNELSDMNSQFLPCPALFSSPHYRPVRNVKKIGLLYGSNKAVQSNNISDHTYNYMKEIYDELLTKYSDQYEFEFIAHYIDEIPHFQQDYPEQNLRYSYDSKEYIDIFSNYDLIIGHRVHGIGMCASMGTPGIMIAHDHRADTVKGFLAEMVSPGTSKDEFLSIFHETIKNIEDKSNTLIQHRKDTEKTYLAILRNTLSNYQ